MSHPLDDADLPDGARAANPAGASIVSACGAAIVNASESAGRPHVGRTARRPADSRRTWGRPRLDSTPRHTGHRKTGPQKNTEEQPRSDSDEQLVIDEWHRPICLSPDFTEPALGVELAGSRNGVECIEPNRISRPGGRNPPRFREERTADAGSLVIRRDGHVREIEGPLTPRKIGGIDRPRLPRGERHCPEQSILRTGDVDDGAVFHVADDAPLGAVSRAVVAAVLLRQMVCGVVAERRDFRRQCRRGALNQHADSRTSGI